jgi:hypothetical protein
VRFIHNEARQISEYVELTGVRVALCHSDGAGSPMQERTSAIEAILRESHVLWGLSLPYYLSVSTSVLSPAAPLNEAVAKVEAAHSSKEFLVVAHQDGGIISVSGMELPFQKDAEPADWWRPTT